jgi:hypothetical protein
MPGKIWFAVSLKLFCILTNLVNYLSDNYVHSKMAITKRNDNFYRAFFAEEKSQT